MNDWPLTPAPEGPRGRLLVVGGGIAGLSAAVEAGEAGFGVVLVEREAHLGGRVAQMHQYFPKLCPPLCGLEINLRRVRSSSAIAALTLAEVAGTTKLDSGRLRVHLRQRPRFVTERCTACGDCVKVCPAERQSRHDLGLGKTRAIYLSHPAAFPARYVIDPDACQAPACTACVSACGAQAIELGMAPREVEVEVDGVIWTTGWDPYDPTKLTDLGFGAHPDIITNLMLERLASPQGPTAGTIACPSDGSVPKRVAFVQCAGSRDLGHLEYCSGVCCLASAKQARYIRAACPDAEISVFYIDRRTTGNGERFLATTAEDPKTRFVQGKVAKITVDGGKPLLEFEDVAAMKRSAEQFDLVVLATGMVPSHLDAKPQNVGLAGGHDAYGFLNEPALDDGHFVAGCAHEPMDVASAVRDATSAVARALGRCRRGAQGQDGVAAGKPSPIASTSLLAAAAPPPASIPGPAPAAPPPAPAALGLRFPDVGSLSGRGQP